MSHNNPSKEEWFEHFREHGIEPPYEDLTKLQPNLAALHQHLHKGRSIYPTEGITHWHTFFSTPFHQQRLAPIKIQPHQVRAANESDHVVGRNRLTPDNLESFDTDLFHDRRSRDGDGDGRRL